MTIDLQQVEVKHNPEENRFEVVLDGKMAMVEYMIAGKNIIFTHTEGSATRIRRAGHCQ